MSTEVVHACPGYGEALTLCCHRTPWELPPTDRMTSDIRRVTCGHPEGYVHPFVALEDASAELRAALRRTFMDPLERLMLRLARRFGDTDKETDR